LEFDDFLKDFCFQDAKIVNFQWVPLSDSFESLSKVMSNGFAGCIHFTPAQFDVKILIFLYMLEKNPTKGSFRTTRTATWIDCVDGIQQIMKPQQQQQGGPMIGMVQQNPQGMNPSLSQQNMGNMQGQGGDGAMMFNQQMQMDGSNMLASQPMNPNQQRMTRTQIMQNNLRHLLQ
jgi:mediator of RNA polymerase II transcription subunit 25